jgi:hypothetical protein
MEPSSRTGAPCQARRVPRVPARLRHELLLAVLWPLLALGCSFKKTGSLRVDWSFGGASCARAGVLKVDAQLDGESHLWFGCQDENDRPGATFRKLSPGTHSLELVASGIGGVKLWTFAQEGIEITADEEGHLDAAFASTGASNPMLPTTPAMRMDDAPPEP